MLDFILFMIVIVIIMCFANIAIRIMIYFYPHYSLQFLLAIFIAAILYSILANDDLKLKLNLKITKKKLIIILTSLIIIFAIFLHHLETQKAMNEYYGIHNIPSIIINHSASLPDQPSLIKISQK